ncbi:MAG: TIGR00730 family Rossman fold protein [Bacteroidota bacterium]
MKKVCVFCGSSKGIKTVYAAKAEMLADVLAENNVELVYGGANIGLMKSIADRMLSLGGKVTGVMPSNLAQREILHEGMTHTIVTEDMQERKKVMEELSDGFIAMPGGFGTMDELFEALSWNQLGLIHKPVGIYNIDHFYDPLIAWLDHAVEMKFVRQEHHANIIVNDDPSHLLKDMMNYQGLVAEKWVDRLKEKGY